MMIVITPYLAQKINARACVCVVAIMLASTDRGDGISGYWHLTPCPSIFTSLTAVLQYIII